MKTALITGASTGIGKVVAIELGKQGWRVGLVARSKELLHQTKTLVEKAGGQAEIFVCDLADLPQVQSLVSQVKKWATNLDLLANIAGIWHGDNEVYAGKDFYEFDTRVILDTYSVGFIAPALLTHGLLPIMPKDSNIINLSGTFENGAKGWLPYFASKRGLEDFTLGLSQELKDKNIFVNSVSPSDTSTEQYQKYFPEDAKDANSPEQIAGLFMQIIQTPQSGMFYVIKKGKITEGFHI